MNTLKIKMTKLLFILHHHSEEFGGAFIAWVLGYKYIILLQQINWQTKAENLIFALFTALVIHTIKILFPNGLSKIIAFCKISIWRLQIYIQQKWQGKK